MEGKGRQRRFEGEANRLGVSGWQRPAARQEELLDEFAGWLRVERGQPGSQAARLPVACRINSVTFA
jgi:hypothetical protein